MASLSENLLLSGSDVMGPSESTAGNDQRTTRVVRKLSVLTVVGLLGIGVFVIGSKYERATSHEHAVYGMGLPKGFFRSANLSSPLSLIELPDCYQYTGGTCRTSACNDFLNTECSAQHLCMCVVGCTGSDGKCYKEKYEVVANGFTLTNKKFEGQKMFMPATAMMNQMKTAGWMTQWALGGKMQFILHKLPGQLSGHAEYFLTTEAYPDYVATVKATAGTALSLFGVYEVALQRRELDPAKLVVRVCDAGSGYIRIGSSGALHTIWAYLHHGSWNVYGWSAGSPGDGGEWKPDPPIPGLQACP